MKTWTIIFLLLVVSPKALGADILDKPRGEIVFSRRDGGNLNIYKLNLDGSKPVLIFKNSDPVNSNSLNPHWSEDGARIFFTAMKDGNWATFSCDQNGGDIKIESGIPADIISSHSLANDLFVRHGHLFYLNENGKQIELFYPSWPYDPEFDNGPSEASWGPDRKWVVFDACRLSKPCDIYIVRPDGSDLTKLVPGEEPDWKR